MYDNVGKLFAELTVLCCQIMTDHWTAWQAVVWWWCQRPKQTDV